MHSFSKLNEAIFISYLVILSLAGYYLRETDLDYLFAAPLILWGCVGFFFAWFTKYDFAWLIPLFFCGIALIFSLGISKPVNPLLQALMFVLPLISLASRNIFVTPQNLAKFLLIFTALSCLALLYNHQSVIQALTGTAENALYTSNQRFRFHTYFSVIICFIIIPALLEGLYKTKFQNIFLTISLVVFIAAAAHRAVYLSIVMQILYWVWLKGNGAAFLKAIAALTLIIIFLLFTNFGDVMMQKILQSTQGADGNTNQRIDLSLAILKNSINDFWGVGFGNYFKYGINGKNQLTFYALQHNSYLSYLYYLGWFSFLSVIFWQTKLFLDAKKYQNSLINILATALFGMSFFALTNVFLEQPIYAFCYWLTYGLLIRQFAAKQVNP